MNEKLRYKIPDNVCPVCGKTLSEAQDGIQVCAYCRTKYDLVNGKIDNTDTMVCISDCKHRNPLFIGSSRWTGDNHHGSYHITLCKDCGQFTVIGHENNQHYRVHFDLVTDEQVEAAGRYARLLQAEMDGSWVLGEGSKS